MSYINLINGNALLEVAKLPLGSFDIVVADPPVELSLLEIQTVLHDCMMASKSGATIYLYGKTSSKLATLIDMSGWTFASTHNIRGPAGDRVGCLAVGFKSTRLISSKFLGGIYVQSPKGYLGHPTAKRKDWFISPLALHYHLNRSSNKISVLDPFAGLGAVGKICQKFDFAYTGIELNKRYYYQAKNELAYQDNEHGADSYKQAGNG